MDTTVPHTTQRPDSLSLCPTGQGRAWRALHIQLVTSCWARPFSSSPENCQENHPRPGEGQA